MGLLRYRLFQRIIELQHLIEALFDLVANFRPLSFAGDGGQAVDSLQAPDNVGDDIAV